MTALEHLKLASEILYKSPYERSTAAAHFHLDEGIEQLERERDACCVVPLPSPIPPIPPYTTDDEVPF